KSHAKNTTEDHTKQINKQSHRFLLNSKCHRFDMSRFFNKFSTYPTWTTIHRLILTVNPRYKQFTPFPSSSHQSKLFRMTKALIESQPRGHFSHLRMGFNIAISSLGYNSPSLIHHNSIVSLLMSDVGDFSGFLQAIVKIFHLILLLSSWDILLSAKVVIRCLTRSSSKIGTPFPIRYPWSTP